MRSWIIIFLFLLITIGGWSRLVKPDAVESPVIVVAAASSLREPLDEVATKYEQKNKNIKIKIVYGGSETLKEQILHGAQIDLFLSAGIEPVQDLYSQKKVAEIFDFLRNELVLVTTKDNNMIKDFNDLKQSEVKLISIALPSSAPVGKYGLEVLEALGLWEKVDEKIVFAKDASQVALFVATGNADAGLVYRTDVYKFNNLKVTAIANKKLHSPIVYQMAILNEATNLRETREFARFLLQRESQAIFTKYGFKKGMD
ncbi:molybdate ABC transporter substrate-binding protein [Carboxydocella sp. ULO1]|uniref:molybdate ABC transporter substrate-binding protein n=2 Tax=unclassified Carboxydocella TaxID=2685367 RepID=UPI0009D48A69|nr:molybdate ABC transporter substrate-binding protein [Carboxydocella sp. ULO1]GAW28506.1 molybdate ABC transporter substrate-binding protein [Carboxydocella sp. ULO1]